MNCFSIKKPERKRETKSINMKMEGDNKENKMKRDVVN